MAYYSGRNALAVVFQLARGSAKAFEQGMYCKSARLQQRRRAGGLWLAARANKGWSGCAVLGNSKAHLGELASPPPPAQCAAVRARAMPLVHGAASPLAAPCVWQEAIRSCLGRCFRWLPKGSTRQQHGDAGGLAVPTVVPLRCAPLARRGPCSRFGRPWVVALAALRYLTGLSGPRAEFRGLQSLIECSRVCVYCDP